MTDDGVPASERAMVAATERHLYDRGVRYATEVPFLHRSIDLLMAGEGEARVGEGGERVAVEFKLRDWRTAITQCADHVLGADRVFVALPALRVTEAAVEACREAGVGLMAWQPDGSLAIEVASGESELLWEHTRAWLEENFAWRSQNMRERGEWPPEA